MGVDNDETKGTGKRLNLGCGLKHPEGYVNHDLTMHHPWVDIAWDLNVLPWPWDDGSFDMVIASSVLEHLSHSLLVSMDELWRITAPTGWVYVKLPYWKAQISWNDLTHFHKVGLGVMDQLDPRTKRGQQYSFYSRRKWEILEVKLNQVKTSVIWKLRKRPLDWNPG